MKDNAGWHKGRYNVVINNRLSNICVATQSYPISGTPGWQPVNRSGNYYWGLGSKQDNVYAYEVIRTDIPCKPNDLVDLSTTRDVNLINNVNYKIEGLVFGIALTYACKVTATIKGRQISMYAGKIQRRDGSQFWVFTSIMTGKAFWYDNASVKTTVNLGGNINWTGVSPNKAVHWGLLPPSIQDKVYDYSQLAVSLGTKGMGIVKFNFMTQFGLEASLSCAAFNSIDNNETPTCGHKVLFDQPSNMTNWLLKSGGTQTAKEATGFSKATVSNQGQLRFNWDISDNYESVDFTNQSLIDIINSFSEEDVDSFNSEHLLIKEA